ncbi:LLM class flavin-dependent oxidoreductase [Microbacterium sp. EYE_5]|uniref:LLM class flavin-dependent oxidoreductase n=1 Tax=unclassified Microbacterium TaxID=2609290 RepID=UPI002004F5C5|nr:MULTISPECIES: LLM class flavin-dependent oxidoreductase [unclassified Microbacterium]MCK6080770.1 LLM class flavin-dependent oxidoreductase [Microbacterium sp. EYE_382]MCK6086041.1 LLM class flavin-dependent oxidoreductase [Microbacterium sp. EYE_384]MCK6124461.1 LLM class flavin-dependent oxidoreductase [Microbacterium sp. EYE_80]MCK6127370.1 LLM class flavin-dependent oxidoreductase [Microbacterium sp. EYE_79]MCK6141725.1 LLM class flavin-dependent oxidoreductase [Microbacterium sp. EYE_3
MKGADVAAVELGLDTFGDITLDADGQRVSHAQAIRNLVDQAALADAVGVDFIGVGEHHRREYAVSSPEIVLAAIAARTERIRLGTAVTVLSSDDPVRVYERFATLDAVSNGRAEVILGRGSFIESFPLFGYDLSDYEALFEEKLELFSILREEKPVTWQGTMRASLSQADVFPKTENGIRAWVGVGGSPESVIRTARYGYGLMLAIIGGPAARFRPYVDLYHRAVDELGTPALPIGIHSPGHIAETDEQAWEEAYPGFEAQNNTIGAERGWPPYSRMRFQQEVGPGGSIYAGSPETVARKIADTVQTLGAGRFDLKYANGTLGHDKLMRSVELYGTRVIPLVREMLGK